MLEHLQITNFQSHADTSLDFVDGVNVLIGTSDSGKSAAIRALCWLATNRPLGSSFIRHGSDGKCRVTLKTSGGTIERVRSKKDNFYLLDGTKLEALRGEVPPAISKLLNMQDINMAGQFDGHFLLTDSPGAIAKAINNAAHLEEAEECSRTLATQHRAELAKIKSLNERANEIKISLKEFESLPQFRELLEKAMQLDGQVAVQEAAIQSLVKLVDAIKQITAKLGALGTPDDWLSACEAAEKLLDDVGAVESEIKALRGILAALRAIERDAALLPVCDLALLDRAEELGDICKGLAWKLDVLDQLSADAASAVRAIKKADKTVLDRRGAYNKALAKFNKESTFCPACGQKLTDSAREKLLGQSKGTDQ